MQLSRYLCIFPSTEKQGSYLLYSTRRGSLARVNEPLLAALRSGHADPVKCRQLAGIGILVDDPAVELAEMRAVLADAAIRQRRYSITAVLNLDCNLACTYCYEDNFRHSQYMSAETARLLLERQILPQIALGRDIHMDFYGGEPLLSLPLLKEIASWVSLAAGEGAVAFTFDLVSNGTLLTRTIVEELLPLGLRSVRMTLDGVPEIHDRQRPFTSGRGSFSTIVANLQAIYLLVPVQLVANYSPDNWRELPGLLDNLIDRGIVPAKFDLVHFSPIIPKAGESPGSHHGGHCLTGTEPWFLDSAPALRHEAIKRGFPVRKLSMSACVVDFDNDYVVSYDGKIYKCPVFMGYPELAVGTVRAGITDYAASHALDRWQNEGCYDCKYLPLCFGGCRFLVMQRGGSMSELDCRREFFDATLEQLVLQDLGRK